MEWRFSPFNPGCRHAFAQNDGMITDASAAICGQLPPWFSDWRGTGNKLEYEKLASLRPCKNCIRKGAPEGDLEHDTSRNPERASRDTGQASGEEAQPDRQRSVNPG